MSAGARALSAYTGGRAAADSPGRSEALAMILTAIFFYLFAVVAVASAASW